MTAVLADNESGRAENDVRLPAARGLSWTAAGAGAITIYGWTEDSAGVVFGPNTSTISVADVASGTVTRIGGRLRGLLHTQLAD